ncbi:hypothetical protein EDD16DRAFT_1529195 [Pisolithus croceorrhizus]|nr:hypothetical protein EDD16DRAFT_1529195 [Pisolithus croceorrhizus]KAI6168890.1 hypothetical protein EDD17DRAFT_1502882 [Pisolithus thermaeus]
MSRAREMQQEHEAGLESLAVLKFYFTRNSVTYSQFTELFEALEGARRRLEKPDTEDEQRVNERPIEAEAHALEVLKLVPEPRGDLCEVPEQAGSVEVEETELGVEAKGQSKVVARRKPPEVKIRRKTLKSVSWMIKEILPEFWTTHSSSRLSGWTVLLIYLQQGWTRSLSVETCTMSPSVLSQPAKRSGTTALHVNNAHSLAPCTCSAAAVEIYTSLSQKSKNCLLKGYEVYGRRLYGVLRRVFEATRLGIEPKQSPGPHWHSGQDPSLTLCVFMFFLECTKGSEESNEHETPLRLVCLLWRVFSVFLEDTLEHNPALSHWTLILVRGLMLSCFCEPTASIYENLGHQERAKRWQSEAPP